jgi:hypothetical protein
VRRLACLPTRLFSGDFSRLVSSRSASTTTSRPSRESGPRLAAWSSVSNCFSRAPSRNGMPLESLCARMCATKRSHIHRAVRQDVLSVWTTTRRFAVRLLWTTGTDRPAWIRSRMSALLGALRPRLRGRRREEPLKPLRTKNRGWVKLKNTNYWRRDAEIEAMQRSRERRAKPVSRSHLRSSAR